MLRTDLEAIIDLPIKDEQKLVLVTLLRFRNGKTGQCNPKKETIALKLRHEVRWVYEQIEGLQRAGYLRIAQLGGGAGRTSNYVLNLYGCEASATTRQENPVGLNTVTNPVHFNNPVGNPVVFNNRNKEEILNTKNTGEHRFPPAPAKGGRNANGSERSSRLDRAIANIDRVCGER